jgi:lactoylglutathione lyase
MAGPEEVLQWVKNDRRRLLHVVYRFGDLDKTIKYDNAVLRLR